MPGAAHFFVGVCAAALVAGAAPARAQPAPDPAGITDDDPSFGPVLFIERIEVEGNRATAERLILRALPVSTGDVLRAGDPRLRKARFKVLAMGYFRAVDLRLSRGSSRGNVVLTVHVVERGTVVLNVLHFGTSRATPWWAGADITERNLAGTGLGLGLGFLYADAGDIDGHDAQSAAELRIADQSILGSPIGAHAGVYYKDASEPYRVAGAAGDDDNANFRAFGYRRYGATAGAGINATPLTRVSVDVRLESVRASLPQAPTRTLPDGTETAVELALRPGRSRVSTLSLGLDRDTRADPVLPNGGDRLIVIGELGHGLVGSSYDYARALARYEHWWPLSPDRAHVLAAKLLTGLTLGDAPLFDQLHVSDVNRAITPRAFGMTMSTETAGDYFGTGAEDATYGELAGSVAIEYSYRLFRRKRHIYGGDLFVGTGVWLLARADQLRARDRSLREATPVGVFLDAGMRLDTELGIFELTLANALGRVPL